MTYELCKELKDAGFPQGNNIAWGKYYITSTAIGTLEEIARLRTKNSSLIPSNEFIYIPTLSELIEACGKGFLDLCRATDVNTGKTVWIVHSNMIEKGQGSTTPENAVAYLWLQLNRIKK